MGPKISSKTLGQISLMQSVVAQLPDKTSILKFVCQGFRDISGIQGVTYRIAAAETVKRLVRPPDGIHKFSIRHKGNHHADLFFDVSTPEAFAPYIPFIENFTNMLAVIFEEKRQRELNRAILEDLENRVKERTLELSNAKELLEKVFAGQTDAIFLADMKVPAVITDCNPAAERQFGYRRNELIGQSLGLLCDGSDSTHRLGAMLDAPATSEDGAVEFRMVHREGTLVTVELSHARLEDKKGNPFGRVVVCHDVTARKRAENDLARSEERFRSLVETTNDWIWEVDAHARYTYVSPRVDRILGFSPSELVGKTPFELMPASERQRIKAKFAKILEKKNAFSNLENVNLHKDGSRVVLETSGVPFFHPDGSLAGYRGIGRDISHRKKTQETLLLTESVFTNTIEGIAITDERGIIQRVNRAFCQITGYSAEEAMGNTPRILKSDHQDDVFYEEMWADLLARGQWSGEIWNRRKDGSVYPEWLSISAIRADSGKITNFVSLFHDITEKKLQEDRLHFLAFHDPLTKLPNRKLLYDRAHIAIQNARRSNRKMALLFMDIDNFKNVNDAYGHPFGDKFLCLVKERIEPICRESDTFSRYGGDEFVIVLNDISDADEVLAFSERIINLFKTPLIVMEEEVYTSISVGIAIFPDDGQDLVTLEKNADMALYEAKLHGKTRSFLFRQGLKDKLLNKNMLVHELRRAVGDFSTFHIVYQPKVETDTGKITGVEALLRWEMEGRPISPMEFIPVAEETNLIVPIGAWLMEKAMAQLKAIHDAGTPHISLSVNLSAKQFNDPDLLSIIGDVIQTTGMDGANLCFEITESIPMVNTNAAIAIMEKINAMGVRLSMDDFGTGYSSLSTLTRFPIQELKIDRSFIRELPGNQHHATIANTIIQMAKALDLDVVAEGVETRDQLDFLKNNGCRNIQGYFFYKPLLPDQLRSAIAAE
ncbi:MAG TPA: hypothetical protein DHV36_03015 [Desulfobacteraceae bacterium]|nr:hypothetical protein [Desulfobacteraceae bacterium]